MGKMLSRFRKSGGFQQLLTLLESCDKPKQAQLIRLISQEDPGWAQLVKIKVLTLERVLSWPPSVLSDIFPQIPRATLLRLFLSLNNEHKKKVQQSIPKEWSSHFQSAVDDPNPTESEVFAATVTLLHTVREMSDAGIIRFDAFDPDLCIDSRVVA